MPKLFSNGRCCIPTSLTIEVAKVAYEQNGRGIVTLANNVGMDIKVPSCADDHVFVLNDVGDIQPDTEPPPLSVAALNVEPMHPVVALAAPHLHPVDEVTLNQSVLDRQLTMQYKLYQQTDSLSLLTQQSDD